MAVQRSISVGDEESNANRMDWLSGIYDKLVRVQSQSTFAMTCGLWIKAAPQRTHLLHKAKASNVRFLSQRIAA
jgi:hypothetical protein